MDAVIIYESLTGTTLAAARAMADELFDRQVPCDIVPIKGVQPEHVVDADLVIVGSWTDGALVVGQRPAKAKRFKELLPDLTGKRCVVFCTYAIAPGKTLDKLQGIVEAHGGEVLGGLAIRRDDVAGGARQLISGALDAVPG